MNKELAKVKLLKNWEFQSGKVVPKGQHVLVAPIYKAQLQKAGFVAEDKQEGNDQETGQGEKKEK